MARKATQKLVDEGYSKLDAWAIGVHEMYRALRRAGFPVDLALAIIVEKNVMIKSRVFSVIAASNCCGVIFKQDSIQPEIKTGLASANKAISG